ncbi:hypothetical protein O9929_01205 [Vibrio lentus]|nr:hypothetical protein [Vibrio lentus]
MFLLECSSRLVIDLKHTNLATKLPVVVKDSPVLSKVRAIPRQTKTPSLGFRVEEIPLKADLFKLSLGPWWSVWAIVW